MRWLAPGLPRFVLCFPSLLLLGNRVPCLGGESRVWLDLVSSQSTLNSSATLEGQTDSHTQSLTGRARMAFQGGWPPTSAKLLEFQFQTTNGQVYTFHYGFFGSLSAIITGLIAKGLPCVGIQSLSSNPPIVMDAIAGTLSFTNDSVQWSGQLSFSGPALASAPDFGSIQGTVAFVARGVATPIVAASASAGSLTLSWPALTTAWKPEVSSALASGATWTPAGIVPARTDGDLSVSIPLKNGSAFFRLVTGP